LGVEGLGCYGGASYRTPNLDALAAGGMRFSHAYAQPLCAPTRIELMTGKENHRNWTYFGVLDPKEKTFGHLMRGAGYRTCIAGKWQLTSYDPPEYPGSAGRRGKGMRVEDAGFEEYSLWHTWHTEEKGPRYADPVIYENGEFRKDTEGKYGEDLWVDFIGEFLDEHREEPCFVYYPMALPHWPMVPTPDSPEWADPATRSVEDLGLIKDMIEYTDVVVGRLVAKIEALGLREETLILFYSDNGTNQKITSTMKDGREVQGGKGLTTDAGIRVPLIANWPGKVKAGEVCGDLVDPSDFLVTVAEVGGVEVAEGWGAEGVSFAPRLRGEAGTPREACFFWYDPRPGWDKDQFTRQVFALDKRYKLYEDGRFFDVVGDLLEENPLGEVSGEALVAKRKLRGVIGGMLAE
ncbi:MAG: sulfatase-like hydrolase/transferase, partial [Verrucomicrobiales bacterium]|nr:sulfatase-like hydrolase/transferase [Verrucomicrobiales bacterium]